MGMRIDYRVAAFIPRNFLLFPDGIPYYNIVTQITDIRFGLGFHAPNTTAHNPVCFALRFLIAINQGRVQRTHGDDGIPRNKAVA